MHRLNWGKVWNYGEKGSKSTVLAWSPDGKGVSYSQNSYVLISIATQIIAFLFFYFISIFY